VAVGGGGVRCEQLPGPPVRFEDITVELQDSCAGDLDAVHERVRQTLIRWAAEHDLGEIAGLRLLVACVRLTGRLADRAAPRELAERCEQERLVFPEVSPPVVVRRVEDRTRPAIDLETLAGESTPIGHVAQQILALREGRAGPLLTKAEQEIERIRSGGFEVDDETYPLPSHGELLERAAWRLLDTLLLQRGEREEANS
jgi:hypothetical protein